MSNSVYFTATNETHMYKFYYSPARMISAMQFDGSLQIGVKDASGKVELCFKFIANISEDMLQYVCEIVRAIAYSANGSVRKLIEDHRVLHLMKELNMSEILHVSRKTDDLVINTLWTPEDAEALLS